MRLCRVRFSPRRGAEPHATSTRLFPVACGSAACVSFPCAGQSPTLPNPAVPRGMRLCRVRFSPRRGAEPHATETGCSPWHAALPRAVFSPARGGAPRYFKPAVPRGMRLCRVHVSPLRGAEPHATEAGCSPWHAALPRAVLSPARGGAPRYFKPAVPRGMRLCLALFRATETGCSPWHAALPRACFSSARGRAPRYRNRLFPVACGSAACGSFPCAGRSSAPLKSNRLEKPQPAQTPTPPWPDCWQYIGERLPIPFDPARDGHSFPTATGGPSCPPGGPLAQRRIP